MPEVFVHLVTYGSGRSISRCLHAALDQDGFSLGQNLTVAVTDNASGDGTADIVASQFAGRVKLRHNSANLGFCGGHNCGVADFLAGSAQYLLILNPDVRLERGALAALVGALEALPAAGAACARLYRADDDLNPVEPRRLDSAGMYLSASLRHFDRGSERPDGPEYDRDAWVFGGTGACLLLRRSCVEALLLPETPFDDRVHRLYPQLAASGRRQLFDEAFFAYRDDADLAWRAQLRGISCRYVAGAVGHHTRVVLPERRGALPAFINRLGVRNRFLLQSNNLFVCASARCFAAIAGGLVLRNFLVIAAVLLNERSSLGAFVDLRTLAPRTRWLRRALKNARSADWAESWRWIGTQTAEEESSGGAASAVAAGVR